MIRLGNGQQGRKVCNKREHDNHLGRGLCKYRQAGLKFFMFVLLAIV